MATSRPSAGKAGTPSRPAARRPSRSAARPAPVQAAAKAPAPAATKAADTASQRVAAAAGPDKGKKIKLVRDSFTMPKTEYAAIDVLKLRAARLGRPAKKSELLRAGVQALTAMTDAQFLAGVGALAAIKTGRPAKQKT